MKFVEIYKLQNDGSQKTIVTFRLDEDKIVADGDEIFIGNVKERGIINYSKEGAEKFGFDDGILFLEQLQFNFKSGYLNASKIKEG